MKESIVRTLKKQHQEELKKQDPRNDHLAKSSKQRRGRPLFLGGLDKMIQTFLKNTRSQGGVVNTAVAIAVADAGWLTNSQHENPAFYIKWYLISSLLGGKSI